MSDNAPSPTDTDKIVTALVELTKQTRESKTLLSDVMAQRTEFAAHVKDLKASIDTTRRALDPEALAKNVADNNTAFMGDVTRQFGRALEVNLERDRELRTTSATLKSQTDKITSETNFLAGLASRLEERDTRSKWDWVTLATAMVVAAGLAGGGAVYFTKQQLDTANFADAIQLIQNDDDAYWCGRASASIVQDQNGTHYCAIAMPRYQEPEATEEQAE